MREQAKFIVRVVGDLESVDEFIGMTREEVLETKALEAMQKVREEAIAEATEIIRSYPLQNWAGEEEVLGEIENIAKRVESLTNKKDL